MSLILVLVSCASTYAPTSIPFVPTEEFVELVPGPGLSVDLRYATTNNFVGVNMYGNFKKAYLHKVAADKLNKAIAFLQESHPGYRLLIFDALRPRSVQYRLWEKVKGTPQQMYVANPEGGSVHNYGFAVDLSVVDARGKELDMGTPFDDFTPLAQPEKEDSFLKAGELTAQQIAHRKILREAMVKAGFIQLPHEWWHYDALPKTEIKAKFKIVE